MNITINVLNFATVRYSLPKCSEITLLWTRRKGWEQAEPNTIGPCRPLYLIRVI